MKIIFSRKGFDSASGKVPSPIFPDGRLCYLPIPDPDSGIQYDQVQWNDKSLGGIVEDLTHRSATGVHLDPDINPAAYPRQAGWRGLFGQSGAAQSHLENQGVGKGDLFLFFGWYRQAEVIGQKLRYVRGAADLHVIFGWLQVAAVEKVSRFPHDQYNWAKYHPHFTLERYVNRRPDSNTLYIAEQKLDLGRQAVDLPGSGVFPCDTPMQRLTASSCQRRWWRLPRCFYPEDFGHALSYHPNPVRWHKTDDGDTLLETAGRGQEFVLDCEHHPGVDQWLVELFGAAHPSKPR